MQAITDEPMERQKEADLSGKVAIPKASTGGGFLDSGHKQMLWWVLNIGVVLVAVLAFSKRSAAPAKDSDEDE